MASLRPGLTALVTYRPDGTQPRALAQLGHLSPAVYSYVAPGGCDALSATFYRPPRWRTDALDPGRKLVAFRGGAVVWRGIIDEPDPGDQGWTISAHGAGSYGNDYRANWSGAWGASTVDQVVNNAIGRGMDWVNPGVGSPSGLWVGQSVDSGSTTVTDVLNNACSKGGLTWVVATLPQGNVLSVVPIPTAPNRLLAIGDPLARTVALGPTTLYVRFQASADASATPATYLLTSVTSNRDALGRVEDYADISSAGVQSPTAAQALASSVLAKFRRVAFTGDINARFGQLRTLGGTAVDPGAFYADGQVAGMVCKVLLADYTPTADVIVGAPAIQIGTYQWDDGECTATLTPAESIRHDFASLLAMITDTRPGRTRPTDRGSKAIHH